MSEALTAYVFIGVSVVYSDEAEAMGRRSRGGARPVTTGQNGSQLGCFETALSNLDERADDVADHVGQEGIGRNVDDDLVALPGTGRREDGADGRVSAGVARERGEVVLADQGLQRGVHRLGVQRLRDVPAVLPADRWARAAVHDRVAVLPTARRKAGVEVVWHHARPHDGDGRRQVGVERTRPLVRTEA